MKIKTYIINLKDSSERREYALNETSKYACMDVELVEAVDGRILSSEEAGRLFGLKRFAYRYGRLPFPGEIGCTLSHRKCYRLLLDSAEEVALILEDDVVFLFPEDTVRILEDCARILCEKKEGLMTFSYHKVSFARGKDLSCGYRLHRVWWGFGSNACLVHRNTARKLLQDAPASILADDYQYMNMAGVRVYGMTPNFSTGLTTNQAIESVVQLKADKIIPVRSIPLKYRLHNLCRGGFRRLMLLLGIMNEK